MNYQQTFIFLLALGMICGFASPAEVQAAGGSPLIDGGQPAAAFMLQYNPPETYEQWVEYFSNSNMSFHQLIGSVKIPPGRLRNEQFWVDEQRRAAFLADVVNRRVDTINSIWGYTLQTFPIDFWNVYKGGRLKDRAKVLNSKEVYGKKLAEWAWDNSAGACEEHSALMAVLLSESGITRVTVLRSEAPHAWPVVNLAQDADQDNPWTWGEDAYVPDSWTGKTLTTPREIWDHRYYFAQGRYYSSAKFSSREKFTKMLARGKTYIEQRCEEYRQLLPKILAFPPDVRAALCIEPPKDVCVQKGALRPPDEDALALSDVHRVPFPSELPGLSFMQRSGRRDPAFCTPVNMEDGGNAPPLNLTIGNVPQTVKVGDTIQLSGQASGGRAPYRYQWAGARVTDDTNKTEPFRNRTQATATFDKSGPTTITLYVADTSRQVSQRTVTLNVLGKVDRLAADILNAPQQVNAGARVALTGQASGGVEPYSYKWSASNYPSGRTIASPPSQSPAITFGMLNPGRTTITLYVTDSESNVAQQTVTINVLATGTGETGAAGNWNGTWSDGVTTTALSGGPSSLSASWNYRTGDASGNITLSACNVNGNVATCSWSGSHQDATKSGRRSGTMVLTLNGNSLGFKSIEGEEPAWSYKPGYSPANVVSSMHKGATFTGSLTRR